MTKKKKIICLYLILIALMIFLSLAPYKYIFWVKKINMKHVAAYMLFSTLTITILRSFKVKLLNSILYTLIITSILGGSLEYLQSFTISRHSKLVDFLSNYVGLILGIITFSISHWINKNSD